MKHEAHAKNEQGSLFIMVLLVLLILTGVALSLMFVTEIEMQLGGTERVMTQAFYGAESGLHAALAGLPHQNWEGEKVAFVEGRLEPDHLLGTRVTTSRIHAVGSPRLPPMSMANEGDNDYHTFSIALRSVSERVAWPAADASPLYEDGSLSERNVVIQSRRSLMVRYLVSPVQTPASADEPYNSEESEKFHF